MNEVLFIAAMFGIFISVMIIAKFFGKEGLIAFVAIATVLANIFVTKQVNILGFNTTLGSITFSSIFLCTDIISEVYGFKESKKAVKIGFMFAVIFIIATQVVIAFEPNSMDLVQDSMMSLFGISLRTTLASLVMFFASNISDVYLFAFLKKKFPNSLWLRNNISTILCNGIENFLFVYAAFIGIYSAQECLEIALTTCLFEVIISICDTPFVYWGRKIAKVDEKRV
ncbi:MAG: queuosine precursor transporter [Clostridia bacterium]|nr:queuosine precursor transporter [Clostridia bacterium]